MILVIGATAISGAEVTRQLVARGVGVRALVRDRAKAEALLGTKVQLVAGDLSRPETVAAAMDGADKLFLSAGMPEKLADLMSELYALGPAVIWPMSPIRSKR